MLSRFASLVAQIGLARATHLLVACGVLTGFVLAAGALLLAVNLRAHDISDAERSLRNLSLVLSEEFDRSIQSVELVQLGLIASLHNLGIDTPDQFEAVAGSFEMHENLQNRIAGLSHIGSLALLDRYGRRLNLTRVWPSPPIDDHDRDFVQAHLGSETSGFFISAPSHSKSSGKWTIYFSRGITAPDGGLIGILVATIQSELLEELFSRISVQGDASFALYRSDGVLLARYPQVDLKIGKAYGDTPNFNRVSAALDKGTVRQVSLLDGDDRVIAPHSVAHYPLLVAATSTMDSILANWRAQIRIFGGATILMEIIIAATVLVAVRHMRGYERLEAAEAAQARACSELRLAQEREQAARELRSQWVRFDTALNHMVQGLLMFDQAGQLLVVNRRFNELFALPDGELVPGMGYADVTERIVTAGSVTADEMRGVRERRAALIGVNACSTATWELRNGRTFNVSHRPMEEGWLTTYEEITERRQAEARIAHLAHHDALTGLPNRVLFREKLELALTRTRRGQTLALLCLDLDQFKAVNDTLGHPVGDALLQAVAERLLAWTRETETVVARLGGDEFAIVQMPIEKPIDATGFARRLIEMLDSPFDVAGHQIVIGTSIGIAFAPQDGLDPDQLLRSADLALYRAKVDGRGIYRLFHAEMDAQMQARRLLEIDLRQALKVGQLEPFYQPLVDLRTGAVAGFEALLRWRHPEKGIVPPNHFIPLAEEIGLIVPIGEWVLRQACTTAASWPGDIRVAVNLSPVQFKSRNLVTAVGQALREADLSPDRLELEITETVMLQDTDATLATLHQLHALGVRIAMDDFGTGYSSLSYLRRFPFDRIKIDQSFIRDLCKKQDCGAIVRAVACMSNELGVATTAEGVETREQLDAVTVAGCSEVQGYLFSPAVPSRAVPDLLQRIAGLVPVREPAE